jgi:hypothetical protein
VSGGSGRLDNKETRRRRSPVPIGRELDEDGVEGLVKGEDEAGSRCTTLKRSSPCLRRWQRPSEDGGIAGQWWWRGCDLGEGKGRGEGK